MVEISLFNISNKTSTNKTLFFDIVIKFYKLFLSLHFIRAFSNCFKIDYVASKGFVRPRNDDVL